MGEIQLKGTKRHIVWDIDDIELGAAWEEPEMVDEDGQIAYLRTSSGDVISRSEIEQILNKGHNPKTIPVCGEVSYWVRGEELVFERQRAVKHNGLPTNFSPVKFVRDIGFSENEAILELSDSDVANRIRGALEEGRIWDTAVTVEQAALMFLCTKQMNHPAHADYFLLAIEAIILNRVTTASIVEAFINVINSVHNGEITWNQIAEPKMNFGNMELPINFFRKKEVFRVYTTVVRAAKLWAVSPYADSESGSKVLSVSMGSQINLSSCFRPIGVSDIEFAAQVFSNLYSNKLYVHLEVVAETIGRGYAYTEQDIEKLVKYLRPICGKHDITFKDIERDLFSD